ncbi:MAG: hypothetical protein ACOX2Z_01815 [Minisyncoccales bacterium]
MSDFKMGLITFAVFWSSIEVLSLLGKRLITKSLNEKNYHLSILLSRLFVVSNMESMVASEVKFVISNIEIKTARREELRELILSLSLFSETNNLDYIPFIEESRERKDVDLMNQIAKLIPSKAWRFMLTEEVKKIKSEA